MRFWKGKAVWILAAVLLASMVAFAVGAVSSGDITRLKAKLMSHQQLTQEDLQAAQQLGAMPLVNQVLAQEKAQAAGIVPVYVPPRDPLDDYVWSTTTYSWVDISTTGTATGIITDDGQGGPFNLGFSFPFYGTSYTQVWADANGILSFAAITGFNELNVCIPDAATPNLAVYPFWDDMTPNVNGTIKYYADAANHRFIMAWIGVGHYSGGVTPETFEVILDQTGNITYQYQTVGNAATATVGIENGTGTQAVQVWCSGAGTAPTNNTAWLIGQQPGYPQPPTNFTANYAAGNVTLDWVNPTLDSQGNPVTIDSLQVWLGSVGGTYVAHVTPPAHGYVHANSTPGSYTYYVRAFHGTNAGGAASAPVVVGSPTYNNNFELDNGSWVADPPTGGWAWGTPTVTGGPTAHSGNNVWGTSLAANYADNACYKLTLSLGLSVISAQASVEFWGWYQVESSYDGCTFQVSTDQGTTWATVQPQGNYPSSTNTSQTCMPSTPAWTNSTVVPWTHYVIPIGQFNGQVVQFRFMFGSDGSVEYPGFFFDDMIIWGLAAPTTGPVSGTVTLDGGSGVVTNATVVANGLGSPSAHPAANGTYNMAAVQTGPRILMTTLAGYDTARLNVTVTTGGLTNQNMTIRRLPPAAPTGLTIVLNSTTGRDSLHWDASPDLLVDGYKIYDRVRDSTVWHYRKTVYGRATHNWGIDTLTVAGIWVYAVSAIDTGVAGGSANPVESALSAPTGPQVFGNLPPVALTADGNHDNKIVLNWLAPGTPPEHEAFYDDGTNEVGGIGWTGTPTFGWMGAHFQGTGVITVTRIKVFWTNQAQLVASAVACFADTGTGTPTLTPLGVLPITRTAADTGHFVTYDIDDQVFPTGSFFVMARQIGVGTTNYLGIGGDQTTTFRNNTFYYNYAGTLPWTLFEPGLLAIPMIRCFVMGQLGQEIELLPTEPARGPVAMRTVSSPEAAGWVAAPRANTAKVKESPLVDSAVPHTQHFSNYYDATGPVPPMVRAFGHNSGRNPFDMVTKYIIFRDGARRDSVLGTVLTYNDTPLPENQTHQYYVVAQYDNVNLSAPSNTVSAACNNPPAAITNAAANAVGTTQVRVSWSAPTLNQDGTPCVDLAGYYVYRDGTQIGQVAPGTTEHISTPPAPTQFYTYTVKSYDEVPNLSAASNAVQFAPQSPWRTIPLEWVDISGNGTATGITADDGAGGPFNLGFTFAFYGSNYTTVYANANGVVSFASVGTGFYTNSCIPSTATPNCALYPFWDDMDPSSGGTIKYFADASNHRFIMAWIDVPMFNTGEVLDFEVIIYENGAVTYNYQTMATNNECTVGTENCAGSDAIQLACDGDGPFLPTSGTAVQFWGGPTSGITGIVRGFSPNIPIQSAKVWVTGGTDTTVTDAGGSYQMGATPGTYTVNFRHSQYCDTSYAGVVVVADQMTTRNATMRQAAATFNVSSISRTYNVSTPASTDSFSIQNSGGPCALNYTITDSATWVSESPVAGSIPAGQTAWIHYTYGTGITTPGLYQSSIMVYYNSSTSPKRIPFDLNALTAGEPGSDVPTEFALHQNYPNPFNPTTAISFDVPRDSRVEVVIYNMMGQEVAHPVSSVYTAGRYQVIFDATNLPTGTYITKMTAGDFSQISKMLLLK